MAFVDTPFQSATIAIVDDDEDVRVALGELLQSFGYEARLFSSADMFLASPALGEVNCVISDVHMPGTSGVQLAALIQKTATPVILITAYPSLDLDQVASRTGVVGVFRKPFEPARLIQCLEGILEGSR